MPGGRRPEHGRFCLCEDAQVFPANADEPLQVCTYQELGEDHGGSG